MAEDIREESGIMLIRRDGCHLLNLEKLLQNHPNKSCRKLKTPELVQWDSNTVYVLEAKSSIPREKKPSDKLQRLAKEEEQSLSSSLDEYARELYEKFASALACMSEDGKRTVFGYPEVLTEYVDDESAAKAFHIGKIKRILLLVLIPKMPSKYEEDTGNALAGSFIKKIKVIFPQCELRAINAESAYELKLARPLDEA